MVRVSRDRVVLLTRRPCRGRRYWLTRDYLPGADGLFGELSRVTAELPGAEIERVAIPHDCRDGFVHAWWRRPRELLRPEIRATMALFDRLPPATVRPDSPSGSDLDSGAWGRRNHDLLGLDSLDLGHRLVVWRGRPA